MLCVHAKFTWTISHLEKIKMWNRKKGSALCLQFILGKSFNFYVALLLWPHGGCMTWSEVQAIVIHQQSALELKIEGTLPRACAISQSFASSRTSSHEQYAYGLSLWWRQRWTLQAACAILLGNWESDAMWRLHLDFGTMRLRWAASCSSTTDAKEIRTTSRL